MAMSLDLELRDRRLLAELNEEYYRARAANAAFWDRAVQILSAVSGLSAVVVWIASAGPAQKAWALLLVLSAVLSAVSPVVRWFDDAVKFTDLASRWTDVAGKLRVLTLAQLDEATLRTSLLEIAEAIETLQRHDTTRPQQRLIAKLRHRVEIRHGLAAA